MRCAVVGHVEWVEFARVPRMPAAGEIVHAERRLGGAGGRRCRRRAAARAARGQLRSSSRLSATTRSGMRRPTPTGRRSASIVHVQWRADSPTRRAWTHVDAAGERTITVLGDKLLAARPAARSPATISSSSSRATRGRIALRASRAVRRCDGARAADAASCGRAARPARRERERRRRALRRLARDAARRPDRTARAVARSNGVPYARRPTPVGSSTRTAPAIRSRPRLPLRSPAATTPRRPSRSRRRQVRRSSVVRARTNAS